MSASTPERPASDFVAALALLEIAEILQSQAAHEDNAREPVRELRIEAIARLRAAWQHGHEDARSFVFSQQAEVLRQIPQYEQLIAEMQP